MVQSGAAAPVDKVSHGSQKDYLYVLEKPQEGQAVSKLHKQSFFACQYQISLNMEFTIGKSLVADY